jgi:hypothetical protein
MDTIIFDQEVVVVSTETSEIVVTGIMGPPGPPGPTGGPGPAGLNNVVKLSDMTDIDKTSLVDGAYLVYRASDQYWKATDSLKPASISIESGEF